MRGQMKYMILFVLDRVCDKGENFVPLSLNIIMIQTLSYFISGGGDFGRKGGKEGLGVWEPIWSGLCGRNDGQRD